MTQYFIADTTKNRETIIKWCDERFGIRATPHTYSNRRWNWFGHYSKNGQPAIRVDIFHDDDKIVFELTWQDCIIGTHLV